MKNENEVHAPSNHDLRWGLRNSLPPSQSCPNQSASSSNPIPCARREVQANGSDGTIAHLVFDLRGTGDSDGSAEDQQYNIDLASIQGWATERFPKANFGFLGTPDLLHGQVSLLPLRPGVVLESYQFEGSTHNMPAVLYMSTYGNFDKLDEARCTALAKAGYEVYGFDPLRYLLHASAAELITPDNLFLDFEVVCQIIGRDVYLIAQPISAGLALLVTGMVEQIKGVTAIGRANLAFRPKHIFDHNPSVSFALEGFVPQISPRPLALIWQDGHPLGGDKAEFKNLYQAAAEPRKAERTKEISPKLLNNLLLWQQKMQK